MAVERNPNRLALLAIVAALLLWGGVLALGAYLAAVNQGFDPRRGLMVAACVAAFVAIWGVLLAVRKTRRPSDGKPS